MQPRFPWTTRARVAALMLAILALPSCVRPVPRPTQPKLVFSIGTEASDADDTRLAREAPVRMLTSWYNGPSDLGFILGFKNEVVPGAYASGRALHLIVYSGDTEGTISTRFGTACGRRYPLADRFLGDMENLAKTFAGAPNGPLFYVTLFTEFQTYGCVDNEWNPNSQTNNYYRALKERYLQAANVFRAHAPNARVSIGWGGWQHRWDSPATGGGRSMFPHFEDVMRRSDFQSFQVMHSDNAAADVRAMTTTLNQYGAVMLAHYKPNNLDAEARALFTDASVRDLTTKGLFAFSFMDEEGLTGPESTYQFVKSAVTKYAL